MTRIIKIVSVVLAFLLPLCATAQIFPHHLKQDKLLGKVKQVTIISNDQTREMYMYDEKGWQTERWFFKPVEVLDHRYKAVYNEKGQLLEETKFDKGIVPVTKYVFAYNPKGMPIGRSLFSENNTLLEKYIYQYDGANRITDSIKLDMYGNIIEKHSWQYDPTNRKTITRRYWLDSLILTLEFEYNAAGKIIREARTPVYGNQPPLIIYSYDEKGNKTEEEKRFANEQENNKQIYAYDSAGNITSYSYITQNGKSNVKVIRVFDTKGKKIEETRYEAGKIYYQYTYKYDERGNEVEMKVYNGSDKPILLTWQYEYDKTGNWTKNTRFVDDTQDNVIKREIEYY